MNNPDLLKAHQNKLKKRYKQLVEHSYNLRQTDHEASDVSAFKAVKLLDKLNKLNYLARESSQSLS
ncbi:MULTISPECIES: Lacal_2735 family protein [unclassified Olleya]|uniref:Lacal_2735 family protein n=1 Tax=unclassified Olleya TaxID=2615019 RepID=UPI000C30A708|nr:MULTISPECIES: Lacal_2735 family protein [unclassified Olleya]AUC77363.1 hypothetical protein CW732_17440 [Olleya sp. Bg11-27]QXP59754.1 Lacal_2735 family protein [Olleya sp. HaHaR_3_96]